MIRIDHHKMCAVTKVSLFISNTQWLMDDNQHFLSPLAYPGSPSGTHQEYTLDYTTTLDTNKEMDWLTLNSATLCIKWV